MYAAHGANNCPAFRQSAKRCIDNMHAFKTFWTQNVNVGKVAPDRRSARMTTTGIPRSERHNGGVDIYMRGRAAASPNFVSVGLDVPCPDVSVR